MKHLINKAGILSLIILAISFLGCEEDDETGLPTVVALFTQTQIENTGVVSFINLSENANSFLWDFGDGTSSTETNPTKNFAEGTFTVTLTAINVAGSADRISDEITIVLPEPPPAFDSGLLTNGDFEAGVDPWIGNAANVQTEGGNSFNLANVETAGNPFDVNLSQVVELTQGTNYILTFNASSDRERTILAGIGLNEAPFTNTAPVVNLTTETQTFTLQLSAADFGSANSRVLFDLGADVGTVVIDNVSLVEGGDGSDSGGGTGGTFDSGLLTNGDFEAGVDPWIGNGANVVEDGGNSFNQVDVQAAGNPFDVNLSQVVELTQGTNYILTFDASSDRNRTILAGIGLNEAPFTNTAPSVDLTTETQTFTLQLSAADFGSANSRVLFDMGAEVGVVTIDNVSLVEGGDGSDTNGGGTGGAFDSGLLTNGDFEAGVDPWIGNGANVVMDGGNSFNQVDVMAAGNPFDVNLSQVVAITQGTNYILTFDASSDRNRTILAGIGLNEAPFTNTAPSVNLTTDTQTFTLQLAANDFGSANSRVLFDMGAEVGVVTIDNVSLVEGGDGSDTNGGGTGGAFDSGLLTNGDFEAGVDPWIGNGANVVMDGGNSFNQVDVMAAGNPFDVNLSQVVAITQGTNYILTFDASSDRNRTILAGIGLNEAPFTNTAPSVNLTTDTQTFTLQLAANDFGIANSRVLFDMGAEVGIVTIDNVSLVEGGDGSDTNGGGGGGGTGAIFEDDFSTDTSGDWTPLVSAAGVPDTEASITYLPTGGATNGGLQFFGRNPNTDGKNYLFRLQKDGLTINGGSNLQLTFSMRREGAITAAAINTQVQVLSASGGPTVVNLNNLEALAGMELSDTQFTTYTIDLTGVVADPNGTVFFDVSVAAGAVMDAGATVIIDDIQLVEIN